MVGVYLDSVKSGWRTLFCAPTAPGAPITALLASDGVNSPFTCWSPQLESELQGGGGCLLAHVRYSVMLDKWMNWRWRAWGGPLYIRSWRKKLGSELEDPNCRVTGW